MNFHVVIPARYASSRLPGKPLLDIAGKPMLQHVYERALQSGAQSVVIATDDPRIQQAAAAFDADVCMTSAQHPSGTDRIAEVAASRSYAVDDIIVNVQGDEPCIPAQLIQQVAELLVSHPLAGIATLCESLDNAQQLFDPNIVKLVMDRQGYALYFSRAPLPWARGAFPPDDTNDDLPQGFQAWRHIGMYAYRVSFLREYSAMEESMLEKIECLEQLRAMEYGVRIAVAQACTGSGMGVDTEADLEQVRKIFCS